jgi:hypothetical protein
VWFQRRFPFPFKRNTLLKTRKGALTSEEEDEKRRLAAAQAEEDSSPWPGYEDYRYPEIYDTFTKDSEKGERVGALTSSEETLGDRRDADNAKREEMVPTHIENDQREEKIRNEGLGSIEKAETLQPIVNEPVEVIEARRLEEEGQAKWDAIKAQEVQEAQELAEQQASQSENMQNMGGNQSDGSGEPSASDQSQYDNMTNMGGNQLDGSGEPGGLIAPAPKTQEQKDKEKEEAKAKEEYEKSQAENMQDIGSQGGSGELTPLGDDDGSQGENYSNMGGSNNQGNNAADEEEKMYQEMAENMTNMGSGQNEQDSAFQRYSNTYDKEKGEGDGSLKLHYPTDGSGLTIGAGYDMKERTAAQVEADLIAAGISPESAAALSLGAGLQDTTKADGTQDLAATNFKNATADLHPITVKQREKLFEVIHKEYEDKAKKAFGGDVWRDLPKVEKDFVFGQTFNTGGTWPSVVALINNADYLPTRMTALLENTKSGGKSMAGVANNRVTAYNDLAGLRGWPTIVKATYNAGDVDGKAKYNMSDNTSTAFNVGERISGSAGATGESVYNENHF